MGALIGILGRKYSCKDARREFGRNPRRNRQRNAHALPLECATDARRNANVLWIFVVERVHRHSA
eukprot:4113604-Prymnesium_polylepis.2